MEGMKKYSTSRNMIKPEIYEQILEKDPETEIKAAPGAKVLDRTPPKAGTLSQYLRYKKKPRTMVGGHKERKKKEAASSGFEFSKISWAR